MIRYLEIFFSTGAFVYEKITQLKHHLQQN